MGCRRKNNTSTYHDRADGTSYCSKCSSYCCNCVNDLSSPRNIHRQPSSASSILQFCKKYPLSVSMSPDKEVSSTTSDSPKYRSRFSPHPPLRNCSSSPLDLRLTPREAPSSPLDLRTSVRWRFPLTTSHFRESPSTTCFGGSQLSITRQPSHDSPPYDPQENVSFPQKCQPDGAKPSAPSNYTGSSTYRSIVKQYSFSSTDRGESSDCSPEVASSPSIYYSTSSSNNSLSSRNYSFSSPSKNTTPQNSPLRTRYLPLSPVYASPYRRANFRREYSPLSSKNSSPSPQCTPTISPRCCSLSPEYKSTNLDYSPDSPTYHPSPPKYRPSAFDYSLASPQSPTYSNSSLEYSPLSPNYVHVSSVSLNDNKLSPTSIDNSPTSPTYTLSSLSYCPFSPQYSSPEYSPTLPKYYRSCDSLNNNIFKSTCSSRYRCDSPTCPYSQRNSSQYSPPIVKYIQKCNTVKKYRSMSPTYYPLSPEYSPRRYPLKFNGRSVQDDDIPCVCCSPSPPRY